MNEISIGLILVAAVLFGYLIHATHKSTIRDLDRELDATKADLVDVSDKRDELARRNRNQRDRVGKSWAAQREAETELRETRSQLVIEREYSARCDAQLRVLAEQLAGKATFPTLAEDDVVVQFPTRRGVR